jgi:hypothetical protein
MTNWGGNVYGKFDAFEDQIKAAGFAYIGQGSFRMTFARKNIVIKIPHNKDGITDNRVEAAAWKKYKKKPTSRKLRLAPCRLLPNGCLMMVKVKINGNTTAEPKWLSKVFCDGKQAGLHKRRYVLYDYACDIPERHQWEKEWGVESEFFTHRCWV